VEVEVEGHLLVENLHLGGGQGTEAGGGGLGENEREPRAAASWAIRPETRERVRLLGLAFHERASTK
jgi:hypothetical protein